MSYHPTECIIDLIAACGPQSTGECTRECKNQCVPFDGHARDLMQTAFHELTTAGLIYWDCEGAWDLTQYADTLIQDWTENGDSRAKAARLARESTE